MKIGDTVWVQATITQLGEDSVRLAVTRDGNPTHVENIRTVRSQVKPIRVTSK